MSHELQNSNNEQERAKEQLIAKVGSAFHEQWREAWHVGEAKKRDEGKPFDTTREKTTSDQAWIEAHGTDAVDIANTTYEGLPEDWKGENKDAAEFVVGLRQELDEAGVNGNLDDPSVREYVGDAIHRAWLSRNEWAKDGDLGVAFSELPLDEQEKDLNQYRTLLAVLEADQVSMTDSGEERPSDEAEENPKSEDYNYYGEDEGSNDYYAGDNAPYSEDTPPVDEEHPIPTDPSEENPSDEGSESFSSEYYESQ